MVLPTRSSRSGWPVFDLREAADDNGHAFMGCKRSLTFWGGAAATCPTERIRAASDRGGLSGHQSEKPYRVRCDHLTKRP